MKRRHGLGDDLLDPSPITCTTTRTLASRFSPMEMMPTSTSLDATRLRRARSSVASS